MKKFVLIHSSCNHPGLLIVGNGPESDLQDMLKGGLYSRLTNILDVAGYVRLRGNDTLETYETPVPMNGYAKLLIVASIGDTIYCFQIANFADYMAWISSYTGAEFYLLPSIVEGDNRTSDPVAA